MKVLFVSRGNLVGGIPPIIKSQGESLKRAGAQLDYFTIKSGGFKGYLNSILTIKKIVKNNEYNIIHAH